MHTLVEQNAAATPRARNAGANASRLDWAILPLISLLTAATILGASEWVARLTFPRSDTTALDCLVLDDPATGVRGIPNCVSSQKSYEENRPVEYRMNSRGHRAGIEPRPKPPDTFRIVMVGSSVAEGMRVPIEQSFATLLPRELSRRTGRKIELYNEGLIYGVPRRVDLAFQDALDLQPDIVLWVLTPYDMQYVALTDAPWAKPHAGASRRAVTGTQTIAGRVRRLWRLTMDALDRSRTALMLRHTLYQSQTQYVRSSLMQADGGAFLNATPNADVSRRLREFEGYASDIEAKAQRAGVPLIATFVPNGPQATMISMGEWPAGSDPFKIGDEVRSIIVGQGGAYIDILHGFRNVLNPQHYFLPVDGHPTAGGHAILTRLLANALLSGAVPVLAQDAGSARLSSIGRGGAR